MSELTTAVSLENDWSRLKRPVTSNVSRLNRTSLVSNIIYCCKSSLISKSFNRFGISSNIACIEDLRSAEYSKAQRLKRLAANNVSLHSRVRLLSLTTDSELLDRSRARVKRAHNSGSNSATKAASGSCNAALRRRLSTSHIADASSAKRTGSLSFSMSKKLRRKSALVTVISKPLPTTLSTTTTFYNKHHRAWEGEQHD